MGTLLQETIAVPAGGSVTVVLTAGPGGRGTAGQAPAAAVQAAPRERVLGADLTQADAVRAGLPLDVLAVVRELARGAQLRERAMGTGPYVWQLERLDAHPDQRLRWETVATRTVETLRARGLVYRQRESARGTWAYYGLAAAVAGEAA